MLTTYDTDADIVRAVEAGANGYLLKDAPRETLADAIRRAARGETVLAPPVVARLASRMRAPAAPTLTDRETEVVRCVARGLSNAEVGRELHIGEATVKTHLLRAFEKLGVTDRTAAVTAAYRARPARPLAAPRSDAVVAQVVDAPRRSPRWRCGRRLARRNSTTMGITETARSPGWRPRGGP